MASFVLVHGSWHGGWCWREVTRILRQRGHDVFTPTLTGLGEREHLLSRGVDLTTHISDVAATLFFEDLRGVTLVGHSYAGIVITGVAATCPDRLARLIYLDAYFPEGVQSWFDLQSPKDAEAGRAQMAATGLREAVPAKVLGIAEPALAAWVEERLRPQPLATYDQPCPTRDDMSSIGRGFIHCTVGPVAPRFAPFAARACDLGWNVRHLATGHDAMLTDPVGLVDVLLELAS